MPSIKVYDLNDLTQSTTEKIKKGRGKKKKKRGKKP